MLKKKLNSSGKAEEKSNPESKKPKEGGHRLNEEYYISKQMKSTKKYNHQ